MEKEALNHKKNFYLIRHGQTDWNASRRIQGHLDIVLNIRGQKEAEQLRDFILQSHISQDFLIASDLKRALLTAKIAFNTQHIQTSTHLRECCLGVAQGLTPHEVKQQYGGKIWHDWTTASDTSIKFPEGESKDEHLARVKQELESKAIQHEEKKNFFVVTHGGCIRQMLRISTDKVDVKKLPIANCSVFAFSFDSHTKEWDFKNILFVPK